MRIQRRVLILAASLAALLFSPTSGLTDPPAPQDDLQTPFLSGDGRLSTIVRPEFRDAPGLLDDLAEFGIEGLEVLLVGPDVVGPDPKNPLIPSRLLLRGGPDAVKRAREVLAYLDVPIPSVMVSLLAAEVVCYDNAESGGHFGYARANEEAGKTFFRGLYSEFEPDSYLRSSIAATRPFQGSSIAFSNIGSSILENGVFEYVFRLFGEENRSDILAWPTIVCTEGRPGIVETSEARTQLVINPNPDPDAISRFVLPAETGTTFTVLPLSVGSDAAVLELTADLRFSLPLPNDGLHTGEVLSQVHRVTTTLTVRDQETLMVGGLTLRRVVESSRGMPIISRVPLLGSRAKTVETSELVIMVRARVLYGGHSGGFVVPPGEARRLDALKTSRTLERLENGAPPCPPPPPPPPAPAQAVPGRN